jgi:hypothetical protein
MRLPPDEGLEMQYAHSKTNPSVSASAKGRHPAAAQRALAEAEARHRLADNGAGTARKEINGRGGLDPARYGDWEVKGIASDF